MNELRDEDGYHRNVERTEPHLESRDGRRWQKSGDADHETRAVRRIAADAALGFRLAARPTMERALPRRMRARRAAVLLRLDA